MTVLMMLAVTLSASPDVVDEAVVLDEIHHAHVFNTELGSLAMSRGDAKTTRALGKSLVVEHDRLDRAVGEYARARKLTLADYTLEPKAQVGVTNQRTGNLDRTTMGYSGGNPKPVMPLATEPPTAAVVDKVAQDQQVLASLRALNGPELDRELLSRMISRNASVIHSLEEWRGHGSRRLDGLINAALKQLRKDISAAAPLPQA